MDMPLTNAEKQARFRERKANYVDSLEQKINDLIKNLKEKDAEIARLHIKIEKLVNRLIDG